MNKIQEWLLYNWQSLLICILIIGMFATIIGAGAYETSIKRDVHHLNHKIITIDSVKYFIEFKQANTYTLKPIE